MSGLDDQGPATEQVAAKLNLAAKPNPAPRVLPLADPATKSAAPNTVLSVPKMATVPPGVLPALPISAPSIGPTPSAVEHESDRVNGMYHQFMQTLNSHLDTVNPIGRL